METGLSQLFPNVKIAQNFIVVFGLYIETLDILYPVQYVGMDGHAVPICD